MSTATETTIVHQGKYGFHSCDYETFKKIKLLHKHFWIAKKLQGVHERYWRKQPQNRVIRKQRGLVLAKPLPMPAPWFPAIYSKILKKPIVPLYQQARHPQPTAEEVKMLSINVGQIDEWLSEIEKAYQEK